MDFNWFSIACVLILLVPLGQVIWAGRSEPARARWSRFLVALLTGTLAFGLLGAAVVQGTIDESPSSFDMLLQFLVAVDPSRLLFRTFDGAALHHLSVFLVPAGLLAVALRRAGWGSVAVAAILLVGLLLPMAGKLVWFGRLRSAGLLDVGGAACVHVLGATYACVIGRFLPPPQQDRTEPAVGAARSLSLLLMIVGFAAYMLTCATMQSPAEAPAAMWNVVRAGVAGAMASVLFSRVRGDRDAAESVVTASVMAMVASAAGGGTSPLMIPIVLGLICAVISPALRVVLRRELNVPDETGLLTAHLFGGIVGAIAAAPFAGPPDGMRQQLVLQMVGAGLTLGVGFIAGTLTGAICRFGLRWR